ncbi:MAG: MFS transporter [Actinomycetota bacterium]
MAVTSLWTGASSDRSAFAVRHFAAVWISGLLWNLTRWGVAFLGTYLLNDMTGSPRLVQLAGTTLYAPLLFGGVAGGLLSDRVDRLRTVRVQLIALIPLSILLGVLVRTDRVTVWIVYVYLFLVGIGWVTDMTSRRALVYDLVGDDRLDHAMAMESISLSVGMILGALVGGSAVEAVGIGAAYFCIAALLIGSVTALVGVTSPSRSTTLDDPAVSDPPVGANDPPPTALRPAVQAGGGASARSAGSDTREAFRILRAQPNLLGLLGVTIIANFFLFAYFPIVPVVADRLGAGPALVGLLSAGTGMGMMIASIGFARSAPRRRGAVHVVGLFIAMAFIVPFALVDRYWLALAMVICSGVGSGLFAATQSALVMTTAPPALRGRALGLLSMAIGALPVGMYALGEFAERTSVAIAVPTTALVGIVALAGWTIRHSGLLSPTGDK